MLNDEAARDLPLQRCGIMGNHRTYKGFCGDAEMKLGGNTILSSLGMRAFLLPKVRVLGCFFIALSQELGACKFAPRDAKRWRSKGKARTCFPTTVNRIIVNRTYYRQQDME